LRLQKHPIPHTYIVAEQRSSRAAENPPYSPFNKGGLIKQLRNLKSLFLKEGYGRFNFA